MKYYNVRFGVCPFDEAFCDILSEEIAPLGFESFEYLPQGMSGYIPCHLLDCKALDQRLEAYPIEGVEIAYKVEEAPDENWNATWEQEGFRPIHIGNQICVHDTRSAAPENVKYDITINPCQAFGTGSHQTTQMLLTHLSQADLEGKDVIDAGTGTGILAIMCRMRGAAHVLAYDIDEWSVRNALSNAELNGVEGIDVREGDCNVLRPEDKAHLLIANINRNILLADMAQFRRALLPGGQLLLSGFYPQDADILTAHAATLGLKKTAEKQEGDWAMLLLEADASGGMDV